MPLKSSRNAFNTFHSATFPPQPELAGMSFFDILMIGILAQVRQWELEQISKRTRADLKVAKARWRADRRPQGDRTAMAAGASTTSAIDNSISIGSNRCEGASTQP